MIVETVVTTLDEDGQANFAAMGVVWGEDRLVIRPYVGTRTFRNLVRAREAVVNVTDDVLVFAKSALSRERFPSRPATRVRGVILADACHWREVAVEEVVAARARAGGGRPRRRLDARRGGGSGAPVRGALPREARGGRGEHPGLAGPAAPA